MSIDSVSVVVPAAAGAVTRCETTLLPVQRDALAGVLSVAKLADRVRPVLRSVRVEYGRVFDPATGRRDATGWSFTATDSYMLAHVIIPDDYDPIGATAAASVDLAANIPADLFPKLGISSRSDSAVRFSVDMVPATSERVPTGSVARFGIGHGVHEAALADTGSYPAHGGLWPTGDDVGQLETTAYGASKAADFFGMFDRAGRNRTDDPVRSVSVRTLKPSVWVMGQDSDVCRVWGLLMPVRIPS
jgi:hypothetical protein